MDEVKLPVFFIAVLFFLAACQPATPMPPLNAAAGTEFTLAPDQTALITDAGFTLRLIGVAGDDRCPSEIECAASGPVSISLSAQKGGADAANLNLQAFTDSNGLAPGMKFEGIEDRVVYAGYLIRLVGVLPYPANRVQKIKDSEYRVTLTVSKE
jgi:hypothetical protein